MKDKVSELDAILIIKLRQMNIIGSVMWIGQTARVRVSKRHIPERKRFQRLQKHHE